MGWKHCPLSPPPTRMLGSGTSPPCLLPQLKPLDPKAGWKGYCVLPGLSDHQVLHHLALQGQGLGQEEGIRPAPRHPHSTWSWAPLTRDVFCMAWLGSSRAIRAS